MICWRSPVDNPDLTEMETPFFPFGTGVTPVLALHKGSDRSIKTFIWSVTSPQYDGDAKTKMSDLKIASISIIMSSFWTHSRLYSHCLHPLQKLIFNSWRLNVVVSIPRDFIPLFTCSTKYEQLPLSFGFPIIATDLMNFSFLTAHEPVKQVLLAPLLTPSLQRILPQDIAMRHHDAQCQVNWHIRGGW